MFKFTFSPGFLPLSALALFVTTVFSSCSEPEKSATWNEAATLHQHMVQIGEQLHHDVEDLMETVNADFDSAVAKGDSALARRLASASARLEHFDGHFHTWNETVVAMPGEGCSHGDHDHGDHDHHHVTTLPDGLSDEDMLEIQAPMMEALEALNREFELIQSASGPLPATDAELEGASE
jgi:hypothetical protein